MRFSYPSMSTERAGGSRVSFVALVMTLLLTFMVADGAPHRKRAEKGDKYLLGVGKADITGPIVEIGMMGYASLDQKGTGLRQRLYARSFLISSPTSTLPTDRFVYVIADIASGDTGIRHAVLQKLDALYPGMYTQNNLALVGTHQHSGPGAWLNYLLPQVTTLGVDKQAFWAIVDGVVLSVKRAHEGAKTGYMWLGKGMVLGAAVNRSPWSYQQNPEEERKAYEAVGGETDKEMTMLAFEDEAGATMGLLNWYPTHGTSLYNNNTLIAGDNKGYAAVRFEKYLAKTLSRTGVITGFSQANMGDASPNTEGPVCQDTGLPCDYETSTCNGKSQLCWGRGPGFRESDTESCRIIGEKQFEAAKRIYEDIKNGGGTAVKGQAVRSVHTFMDMGENGGVEFTDLKGIKRKTCKAALGFSFAAGTTDGPGAFDFTQADSGTPNNPFWLLVRNMLSAPSAAQVACHAPKPILLNVGEMDSPYAWTPNIVDLQLLRAGQLTVIISPGEATTMSGRRWKSAISNAVIAKGITSPNDPWVVLGAPANTYSHYIATPEEYSVQRYEGASTLYGQHTLDAYINFTTKLVPYLADVPPSTPYPAGPSPPINVPDGSISLITGVVYDNPPILKKFGDVLTQPRTTPAYNRAKRDVVQVRFVGANPRNSLRLEGEYVTVERRIGEGKWERYRGDEDWEVAMTWKRVDSLLGTSDVTVRWEVSAEEARGAVESGWYRIVYRGDAKRPVTGQIVGFAGVSAEFEVV